MKQDKIEIKSYFNTGDKPTQEQYHDTWDSFWHKDEMIPCENIESLVSPTSLITASGRLTLWSNLKWVTNAEDTYGPNFYNASEDAGSAMDPIYSFNQLSHIIPSGHKINNATIIGRTDNSIVEDIRFQFVKRTKSSIDNWNGISSDSEFNNTILYDGLWMANTDQTSYTGESSNKAKRVFNMDITNNNNVFNEGGEFFMYLKPIGTFSNSQYFHFIMSIEIENA